MDEILDEELIELAEEAEREQQRENDRKRRREEDELVQATIAAEVHQQKELERAVYVAEKYHLSLAEYDRKVAEARVASLHHMYRESNGMQRMRRYAKELKGFARHIVWGLGDIQYGDLQHPEDFELWFREIMHKAYTEYQVQDHLPRGEKESLDSLIRKEYFNSQHYLDPQLWWIRENGKSRYFPKNSSLQPNYDNQMWTRWPIWFNKKWNMGPKKRLTRKEEEEMAKDRQDAVDPQRYMERAEEEGYERHRSKKSGYVDYALATKHRAKKVGIPWDYIESFLWKKDDKFENDGDMNIVPIGAYRRAVAKFVIHDDEE